jgi:hypothetical protein
MSAQADVTSPCRAGLGLRPRAENDHDHPGASPATVAGRSIASTTAQVPVPRGNGCTANGVHKRLTHQSTRQLRKYHCALQHMRTTHSMLASMPWQHCSSAAASNRRMQHDETVAQTTRVVPLGPRGGKPLM